MAKLQTDSVGPGLVLIRVVTGALLFLNAWDLVSRTGGVPDLVSGADLSSPLFAWWGEELVRERPVLFSNLIAWSELLGGLALVLGALVRPFGLLVAVVMGCCAVSDTGLLRYTEILVCANALALSFAGAGTAFGLDSIFDQHFPRWLTWTRRSG